MSKLRMLAPTDRVPERDCEPADERNLHEWLWAEALSDLRRLQKLASHHAFHMITLRRGSTSSD
jgi:hypothetical protein